MQVEHNTGMGTVLFVKDEEISETLNVCSKSNFIVDELLKDTGIMVVGLTSDITEDKAKMMVRKATLGYYLDYTKPNTRHDFMCSNPLESFKSLMQHLQVYEVNPYGENNPCEFTGKGPFSDKRKSLSDKWQEAQERTGKWVVLFKPI